MNPIQELEPYAGQKLTVVWEDVDNEQTIFSAEHEVVEVEKEGTLINALQTKCLREEWKTPSLQVAHSHQEDQITSAKDILEATKSVWNFIKDNQAAAIAESTTASVISKDTDPLDYAYAKEGKSGTFRLRVHDSWVKKAVYVDVTFRLEGTYGASPTKPGIPNGAYLPSIYFNVLNMRVFWSFKLTAKAEVSRPSNLGSPDQVEPQVSVYAQLQVNGLGSAQSKSIRFVANGKEGFKIAK